MDKGVSPTGPGYSAEPEPEEVSAVPIIIPNAGKSVSGRLGGMKIVVTCTGENTEIALSGKLTTQDELDALGEALATMREWLTVQPERTGA